MMQTDKSDYISIMKKALGLYLGKDKKKSKGASFTEKNIISQFEDNLKQFTNEIYVKFNTHCLKASPYWKDIRSCSKLIDQDIEETLKNNYDEFLSLAQNYLPEATISIIYQYQKEVTECKKNLADTKSAQNFQQKDSKEIKTLTEKIRAAQLELDKKKSILNSSYSALLDLTMNELRRLEGEFEKYYLNVFSYELNNYIQQIGNKIISCIKLKIPSDVFLCEEKNNNDSSVSYFLEGLISYLVNGEKESRYQTKENEYTILFNTLKDKLEKGDGGYKAGTSSSLYAEENSGDSFYSYLQLIESNKALIYLIEKLGKAMGLDESVEISYQEKYEKEHIDEYAKEKITGVTLCDKLEYVLPEELMMLAEKETENLFDIKFLESRILCFDFEGITKASDSLDKKKKEHQSHSGPVIVCYDTSGSMQGSPERIAKAVALILSLKCMEAKRCAYLINFSCNIETFTVDYTKSRASILQNLKIFLARSYYGGTDLSIALSETISKFEKDNKFHGADMLCVTDDCFNCSYDVTQKVLNLRKQKTNKFFELIIGGYSSDSQLFDTVYLMQGNTLKEVKNDI